MRVKGLLLDAEGTIVKDKRYQAIPGAVDFVRRIRQAGLPVRVITNNTTDSKTSLADKLARAGFDFRLDELHTCIHAAVTHLQTAGATRCFILGTAALRDMFTAAGLTVMDTPDVDAVVVGLDRDLTYERLTVACDAIGRNKARFVALHRNRLLLDPEGRSAPSAGAIVEAIRYATQVEPVMIGKPSPEYYEPALADLGLSAESVLVVSDDPLSDLAGAKRMGMQAAFVLSGKYRERSILESIPAAQQPDFTADKIGDLLTEGGLEL